MTTPTSPRPRWSMVLSHHPPSQYDRTLHIGGWRVCARCTGVGIGILIGALFTGTQFAYALKSTWVLGTFALVTLSVGIIAFVLNEAAIRKSNNSERLIFGLIFGSLFPLLWAISWWYVIALFCLTIFGQFLSAFVLRRFGVLDRFFAEYSEGAMVWPDEDSSDNGQCGRFFCTCSAGPLRLPRS